MKIIIIIGILIVLVILLLSVLTINKGYGYKHTIDPIDPLPEEDKEPKKER
ncbi:YtzI protein [Peribacillus cavernae]|uniref:YtzI protein n=1 Tax=Peribacillus cavernae TaxID=1674310 RepID=A0A3S0VST2_9BACI|nr:YtzI protein [Peribacillus cavernae]MDQ0220268.1 hypothetical protein [Peribacillus cavernae]RUQ31930.1 YtzI protein [Peribacillus cavernae]